MLSRSLGAPIGTAVGFSFYLGTTFAGAMYIIGAVESFYVTSKVELGNKGTSLRVYGTVLLLVLLFINFVGLKYVAKTGLVFLSVVLFSILCMYGGIFSQNARDAPELKDLETKLKDLAIEKYGPKDWGLTGMDSKHWEENGPYLTKSDYTTLGIKKDDENMWFYLSVYFPSVTGIMAGANRSGDLQDPSSNLPKGTLGAQIVTTIIYISFPMLFGAVADRYSLQSEEHLIAAECAGDLKYLVVAAIILSSTGAGL